MRAASLGILLVQISSICLLTYSCRTPIGDHHPEWKKYFDGYHVNGCIGIYDLKNSKFIDYNPDRCGQRFIPASTFEICNSLVALQTKVIPDTGYIIQWDSVIRNVHPWNQNQILKTAFVHSADWYFREISRKIGTEKMQQYLTLTHYGNMQMGSNPDSFWIDGNLRISCDEQIEFLKNFYTYQLSFSKKNIDLVKEIMKLDYNPGQLNNSRFILSGKAGRGIMSDEIDGRIKNIGWFVGYVEKGEAVYFFATNVQSGDLVNVDLNIIVKNITLDILATLQ